MTTQVRSQKTINSLNIKASTYIVSIYHNVP